MLDPKLLRTDPDAVARNLARRGYQLDVPLFRTLEEQRKALQVEADRLRAERNNHSRAVGTAKARGEDIAPLMARGEVLATEVARVDGELTVVQHELDQWLLGLPNLLDASVPDGADEAANVELRRVGEPRRPGFEP